MALFLECVFILLQGITEKSEFISDYSLQLAIVIVYVPLWKKHILPHTACFCDYKQFKLIRTLFK